MIRTGNKTGLDGLFSDRKYQIAYLGFVAGIGHLGSSFSQGSMRPEFKMASWIGPKIL